MHKYRIQNIGMSVQDWIDVIYKITAWLDNKGVIYTYQYEGWHSLPTHIIMDEDEFLLLAYAFSEYYIGRGYKEREECENSLP